MNSMIKKGIYIKNALLESGRHKMKLDDGITTILFESEKPKRHSPVFIMLEDGEYIRVPPGELRLENGKVVVINQNGLLEGVFTQKNSETYVAIMKAGQTPKKPLSMASQIKNLRLDLKL